jgi:dihydrofolate synthase/folylpolyglutamate synthase
MSLARGPEPDSHPGEPGIGVDLAPPFTAEDEATRWLFSLNRFGIRPGLGRIRGLLDDLDRPERHLRTLVTAGTNGKGSTTRILARLLRSAGSRVATFTSPHLLRVYERVAIDEQPVVPERFAARVDAIRPSVERHAASWFETLTAVAVQIAAEEEVDFFCCETGLGGRLDATNALPAEAILLTTVALDHQRILGDTREAILDEKLGLLKPDVPFFCGVDEALRPQVFRAAVAAGSPCHFLDELSRVETEEDGTWKLVLRDRELGGLPPLQPSAMRRNAALALLALDELSRAGKLAPVTDPAAALAEVFLPGRFQLLLREPDWILDTAHNEQALAGALAAFADRPCRGRRIVLIGAMHDKPTPPELGAALRGCDAVIAAPVDLPRSRNRSEWEALFRDWDLAPPAHSVVDSVPAALEYWRGRLRPEDSVLVTGSCFMVAEVLHRLGYRDLEETRAALPADPAARG